MPCTPEFLKRIPLLALLDDEELSVLATQVDLRTFAPRQRIYKLGDPSGPAYLIASGHVRVTTIDEDNQEVVVSEPDRGDFLGLSSMLDGSVRQTAAVALMETECIELTREDLTVLVTQKPFAGLDIMTVLARELHRTQHLVRMRVTRHPNTMIEEKSTAADRLADAVARFGGSWAFIITSGILLTTYISLNVGLGSQAWDPYPFILLNLFLSMLAALQAPIIMMSQNRQDMKDRLRSELDFEVNRRAEAEIRDLSGKVIDLAETLEDLKDSLPSRPPRTGEPSSGPSSASTEPSNG